MASPPPPPWITEALSAHAAESPRWRYVFGSFDAGSLGGRVLTGRFLTLRSRGFDLVESDRAGVLIGAPALLPSRLDQVRIELARAALEGGIAAWKRLNRTTAAHRRLAMLIPGPGPIAPVRFGPPDRIAEILASWPAVRVMTSRFEEVVAYERVGLTVLGQEGVGQAYTVWLMGPDGDQPSSFPTRRA